MFPVFTIAKKEKQQWPKVALINNIQKIESDSKGKEKQNSMLCHGQNSIELKKRDLKNNKINKLKVQKSDQRILELREF